jgi:hypothetical protein
VDTHEHCQRLADDLRIERVYAQNREVIKAALRIVLGLPKLPVLKETLDGPDDQGR